VTVVLLRHAHAVDRSAWEDDDRLRPLDKRGRRQAFALRTLDVRRIVSSPSLRCIETVAPLAAARSLSIEVDERLAEGAGRNAFSLLAELDGGLACTHGDVIDAVLGRELEKGGAAILDVAPGGLQLVRELAAP
jgi:broad specificity phosphatase PhoE